jgi:hypothetical protein
MGLIRLLSGDYLVVITDRELVGRLDGHPIYRVTATRLLPTARSITHLSESKVNDEMHYLQLMDAALQSGVLHYSPSYDLTLTLQRQSQMDASKPMWQRADDRFFWNRHLQTRLIDLARTGVPVDDFILPIVHAFVHVLPADIQGHGFTYALVSRRSRFRAGTRYFSRGVDVHGNVSNFVETEQIVLVDGKRSSFVQTRGSIPLRWTQVVNTKYTPHLKLFMGQETFAAARKHFDDQIAHYGRQVLVNLVNKHNYEKPMGDGYAQLVQELNDDRLHYIHFDFHNECSRMRWERISLLLTEMEDDLVQQGYFVDHSGEKGRRVERKQHGSVRTNCMDCLDRTNVVQSMVARHVLNQQLQELGVLQVGDSVVHHEGFLSMYRHMWADHADVISIAYSGTGALKTDFTRTGKRTYAGALQDLRNSITRYIKNNYLDGKRQDAYDLFLGEYRVDQHNSPFQVTKSARYHAVPIIMGCALLMIVLGLLTYPTTDLFSMANTQGGLFVDRVASIWYIMVYTLFWLLVLWMGVRMMVDNGTEFIDWPKLVPFAYKHNGRTVLAVDKRD